MTLQKISVRGHLTNHTAFGRRLRQAARKALVPHLDRYDFGFQDGGCAMFARALEIWSGARLTMAWYAPPGRSAQHVVAWNGEIVLDSDGMTTPSGGAHKLAMLECCHGCVITDGYHPSLAPRIPWDEGHSSWIAARIARVLPDPASLPWNQIS